MDATPWIWNPARYSSGLTYLHPENYTVSNATNEQYGSYDCNYNDEFISTCKRERKYRIFS
jgi:hypothetical protein